MSAQSWRAASIPIPVTLPLPPAAEQPRGCWGSQEMGRNPNPPPTLLGPGRAAPAQGRERAPAEAALGVPRRQEKESDEGEQGTVFGIPAPTQGFFSVFLLSAFHLSSH